MADPAAEARIRDLERRLDLDSGSRLFVSLADEYRKVGRVKDALSALQKGLLAHPGYVAAQVALGRVYLEANQATDAIATFTKVLVADPANLVAAKSLAEIHLGRNDNLEALKKFKLYRAISGDRKVDEMIAKLEPLVAPKPVTPPRKTAEAPPPPKFQETGQSRRKAVPLPKVTPAGAPLSDAFELTSVTFEIGEDSGSARAEDPFPFMPTRDQALAVSVPSRPTPPAPVTAAATPEAAPAPSPVAIAPEPEPVPPAAPVAQPPPDAAEPVRPSGRALADLYYAQGHYAEALQIYDDLVLRHPFDEDLKRMRRDAEARLLPASTTPAAAQDVGLEQRLARIRALKHWLGLVQAG